MCAPLAAHCPSCGTPTDRYHLCDNCTAIGATAPQLFTTNNPLGLASAHTRESN